MIRHRRLLLLIPAAGAAALIPIGAAFAREGRHQTTPSPSGVATVPASAGDPSAAGWGSVLEAPRAGSAINTSQLVPGLNVTYGAASNGLLSSPPTNSAGGFVAEDASNHPPSVGEIDSFLASDGRMYYRVVNRAAGGVTYSH